MKRTILLTGSTGKVGFYLLKQLSKKNIIIATTRNKSKLQTLLVNNKITAGKLHILDVNIIHKQSYKTIINYLNKHHLYPDCIIHTARSIDYLKINSNGIVNRSNFKNEFLLDVICPYEITMHLAQNFPRALKCVIFVSSIYGIVAPNLKLYENPKKESPIHYGISKAAQIHMTKELAVRLAGSNISVNCISYGGIEGRVTPEFKKRYGSLCPQNKMLNESDIMAPFDLLLSDRSTSITGQNIIVDGGWTLW